MAEVTQDGRILKLTTPLGKDVLLINSFTVVEEISKLFQIDAEVVHHTPGDGKKPHPVDPVSILGQQVAIEIAQPDGTTRYFTGIVNRFSQGIRDDRFTYYKMSVVPRVWLLTQVRQSRIFQRKTIQEILETVFQGLDKTIMLRGSYEPRNYCVQYRESDFDFASRLMEEDGIFYYFEHTANGQKMIIGDTPFSHNDCPRPRIPFVGKVEDIEGNEGAILEWGVRHQLQSGKVTFWDHHFQLTTNKLEGQKQTIFAVAKNQDLEIYDYPGDYAHNYDSEEGGIGGVFTEKSETAQIAIEQLDSRYQTITGHGTSGSMSAGHRFELFNHPSDDVNGKYVITHATHQVSQSPGYFSEYSVDQPYTNEFRCIPFGQKAAPFRPLPVTPKPIVPGSQTAMVVGPSGEEIYTDKYGRVKVQFHWDRHGKVNDDSSCWIRVAQGWAGNRWGIMFIPRIGMEVVVSFLEGDPDQPIITGCVYNAEAMPPYDLPSEQTKSTIKTSSSTGGNGFNELRFEDARGDEQIYIHAERDFHLRVKNDRHETIVNDRHLQVENNQHQEITGDNHSLIKGNRNDKVNGSASLDVGADIHMRATGKVASQAGTEWHMKAGVTTVIEAGASLTLKTGGSYINITPGAISIQAPMVLINSGGAAGSGSGCSPIPPQSARPADTGEAGWSMQKVPQPPPPPKPADISAQAGAIAGAAANQQPVVKINQPKQTVMT